MKSYLFLTISIIVITIAHLVRIVRWSYFIEIYEKPKFKFLIKSLSFGYLINTFIPYKVGDIFRAIYSGNKHKNGVALGLSSVIIERYIDVLSMGFIFIFLYFIRNNPIIKDTGIFYVIAFVVLILFTAIIYGCKNIFKKIILKIASLFNEKIETSILVCTWTCILNFIDTIKKVNKIKLIISTAFMWGLYFSSYISFAYYLRSIGINYSLIDVLLNLFTKEGIRNSSLIFNSSNVFLNSLYFICPLIILYVIGSFIKDNSKSTSENETIKILPYIDNDDKLRFLENYFNNKRTSNISSFIEMNNKITILKDLSAGSNATTILCMDDKSTFYRKYAFSDDSESLKKQIDFICKYRKKLKLPLILRSDYEKDSFTYYDMPEVKGAVNLFDFIHTEELESCKNLLMTIFNDLDENIYIIKEDINNDINKYINDKVIKNILLLKENKKIGNVLAYETLIINGKAYKNLDRFSNILNERYMKEVFKSDSPSIIHGDFTVENIVTVKDNNKFDYYVIDPNFYDGYQTKYQDYAKLMQSLHGKYEFLMRTYNYSINENNITYFMSHSKTYDDLYNYLDNYFLEKYGFEGLRSIYLHELIHWLRLMPYKIKKDENRAVLFFSQLIILLNEYGERFGKY